MIEYRERPPLENETLHGLFSASWDDRDRRDFATILSRSLVYVTAFADERLVGFVNVATDGGNMLFFWTRPCIPISGAAELGPNSCAEPANLLVGREQPGCMSILNRFYRISISSRAAFDRPPLV